MATASSSTMLRVCRRRRQAGSRPKTGRNAGCSTKRSRRHLSPSHSPFGAAVLRRYRRGGAVARVLKDSYVWTGAAQRAAASRVPPARRGSRGRPAGPAAAGRRGAQARCLLQRRSDDGAASQPRKRCLRVLGRRNRLDGRRLVPGWRDDPRRRCIPARIPARRLERAQPAAGQPGRGLGDRLGPRPSSVLAAAWSAEVLARLQTLAAQALRRARGSRRCALPDGSNCSPRTR
jgi:hypothetical protein